MPPATRLVNRNARGGSKWFADRGAAREDGGSSGPPGPPYEEEASNRSPVPWLKTVVLNGVRKGVARSRQVWAEKMSDGLEVGPLPSEASK
jgi:hypothetical protein